MEIKWNHCKFDCSKKIQVDLFVVVCRYAVKKVKNILFHEMWKNVTKSGSYIHMFFYRNIPGKEQTFLVKYKQILKVKGNN